MSNFKSRPLPNDTLFMDLKTPRFLTVDDLLVRWKIQSMDVEISRFTIEETWPSMKDIDPQTKKPKVKEVPVMYFKSLRTGKEYERGMKVEANEIRDALKEATKAKTIGDMIGKKVTIIIGEWHKEKVLRISPTPPAVKPAPAQTTSQPANGHNQPQPIKETPAKNEPVGINLTRVAELKALAEVDIITAYTEAWKEAGLDNETQQAILKEYTGDFAAAFEKIVKLYAPVIG